LKTVRMTSCTYDAINLEIREMLSKMPSVCNERMCPQAEFAGCLLRMAGHDFMDYYDGSGGSDACTDMHAADNAGLLACLVEGEWDYKVHDVYAKYCTEVSLADFLVLAAEASMDWTRRLATRRFNELDNIAFKWRFKYGRETSTSCPDAEHQLPNPEHGCSEVERVFVKNLGLSWEESAALMGVHTLGRARLENSGYDGWWSDPINSRKFNNHFFVSMLANGWMPDVALNGNKDKNQWIISNENFKSKDAKVMMLNSDLCLAFTFDHDSKVGLDARTQNCCAWPEPAPILEAISRFNGGEYCGVKVKSNPDWLLPFVEGDPESRCRIKAQRAACCQGESRVADCGSVLHPTGPAGEAVFRFANDEDYWLEVFKHAWSKATTVGFHDLKVLETC